MSHPDDFEGLLDSLERGECGIWCAVLASFCFGFLVGGFVAWWAL